MLMSVFFGNDVVQLYCRVVIYGNVGISVIFFSGKILIFENLFFLNMVVREVFIFNLFLLERIA